MKWSLNTRVEAKRVLYCANDLFIIKHVRLAGKIGRVMDGD